MKKIILSGLSALFVCVSAHASDGGLYAETSNYSSYTNYNLVRETEYVPRRASVRVTQKQPCRMAQRQQAGEPIAVKTHTEVINHYQVYQPVTQYVPVGTYSQREIVRCDNCRN